ncbi:helix-turn-helix transcriptional regulator [Rudaeicoccus suwonensis]|uniref:Regulatory LuxR family protein n=1 Tax=Rudaeicoccus suwonensis TaxID=657409 RepID=A0A561E7C3_9MICO|nr:LuxR C-terminal-related transcriptional regulator [Rudaeicoccus suwonensis]TWE11504.1 regulatory LuxR family protein [Rudaeicoccus suwonensis]
MPKRTTVSRTTSAPVDPSDDDVAPIYLAMLQSPKVTVGTLLSQGFSQSELDAYLPELKARGLIRQIDAENWHVVSPDVALPAYAAQLEQRARLMRSTSQLMTHIYLRARSDASTGQELKIAPLVSIEESAQALQQIVATAERWAISNRTDSPLSRYLRDAPAERSATPFFNSRGELLHTRLNVDPAFLTGERMDQVMRNRQEAGDEIRLTKGLPFSGAVNDQGMALLDLEDRDGSPVGILLNPKSGSDWVLRCLEFTWRLGMPWRADLEPDTGSELLEPRDRQIVRLMAGGISDLAIARQVGVSPRTVERRVRTVMDRLNASTRFQAGVLAAKNGLI